MRYKRIGYNINIMQQSVFLVINRITAERFASYFTVDSFASLFNCTPVRRASDSMIFELVGTRLSLACCLVIRGSTGVFFICSGISVVLFHTLGFSRCHYTFLSSPHL